MANIDISVNVDVGLDEFDWSDIVEHVESTKHENKTWAVVEDKTANMEVFVPENLVQQQINDCFIAICNSSKLSDLEKLAKFEAIKKEIGI